MHRIITTLGLWALTATATAGCAEELDGPYCGPDVQDLDGDGEISDADCELVGVAAAMREICWHESAPMLYTPTLAALSMPGCWGYEEHTIDDDVTREGSFAASSVTQDWNRLQVAYERERDGQTELVLVQDRNDDGRLDDEEQVVFFTPIADATILHIDTARPQQGTQGAVVVVFLVGDSLRVWHDADGDGRPVSGEIVAIDTVETLRLPVVSWMNSGESMVIAYSSATTGFRIWWDLNQSFRAESGEREDYIWAYRGAAFNGSTLWLQSGGGLQEGTDSNGDGKVSDAELLGSRELCVGDPVGYWAGLVCRNEQVTTIGTQFIDARLADFGAGRFLFQDGVWIDASENQKIDPLERLRISRHPTKLARRRPNDLEAVIIQVPSQTAATLTFRRYAYGHEVAYLGEPCWEPAVCAYGLECRNRDEPGFAECLPPESPAD